MNKMFLTTFLVVSILVIFNGCANNTPAQAPQKTTLASNLPAWVSNPDFGGNIGVVSIVSKSKIKNSSKRLKIAKLKANAQFQTRKGTTIDAQSVTKTKNDGTMSYKENVKITSSHIQHEELIVKDTYEDKDNFYLWMVVKK